MSMHESPHIRTTVGANIRRFRDKARISQMALASAIGSDPVSVSRWERGKVMPRPETLDAVAAVLGVETGELYLRHEVTA